MVEKNCNSGQKTRFVRKRNLPAKLVPGTVYIVESDDKDYVDLYVADNRGNKKTIVGPPRFDNLTPTVTLKLINYNSDIMGNTSEYYYGYEYEDNSFKIISVEKGNVVNQKIATTIPGTFTDNWNNRETLIYN